MARLKQASRAGATRPRRTKISAKHAATESKFSDAWRIEFLDALADTSNVTAASAAAGVHPARPYKARRLEPDFARAWRAALLEGYENLEMEVLHRLRFGEPKDGNAKYDNACALRLLGLHRDTITRERAMRENEDVEQVRASLDAKLDAFRRQVLARRAAAAAAEQAGASATVSAND